MERNQIIEILKEEAYPEYMIEQTANKLENLVPEIKDVFEQWHLDGAIPSITLEGYSYQDLVNLYGMKPVGAFITLDWLKREPEKAARALEKGIR